MKFNNKILGLVFIALLGIYLINKFLNKPEVRSFKEILVSVDTSKVNKMIFYPKGDEAQITLEKFGNDWMADNGASKFKANKAIVDGFLIPVVGIKTLQLVSKNKEKWAEYEVDDMTGKKLELYSNGELLDAFYIGRFNFNQNTRSAKTYMRLSNEDDIYVVDGFLSMTYDKKLNDFRNKKLINGLTVSEIASISMTTEEGILSMEKGLDNNWVDDNNNVMDSTNAMRFLQSFVNLNGNEIMETYAENVESQIAEINLNSESQDKNQNLKIYREDDDSFIFKSSTNSDVFFKSDSSGIFKNAYLNFKALFE